nr:PAS domain S-box protein [Roseicella aerolata]
MADSPGTVLQRLADLVIELGLAQSAGISILRGDDPAPGRHWDAVAGLWAGQIDRIRPSDAGPCGAKLPRDAVLLLARPPAGVPAADIVPRIQEILLLPFLVRGERVGTLWVVAHDPARAFDAEDVRLLSSFADFAAAACRVQAALAETKHGYAELERRVEARTRDLLRANERLGASEERFRRAMSIGTVGVLFFRLDGRIIDANEAFARMSGYSRDELAGSARSDALTPPECLGVAARARADLALRGETAPYEKELIRKDGSRWWGLFAPMRLTGAGEGAECVEVIIDITAWKRTEAALRESEARFRHMADSAPALIWMTDAEGQVVFANMHYDHMFGRPAAEMLGDGWSSVVLAEDLGSFNAAFQDAFRARRAFRAETRVRDRAGQLRWLRCEGVPRLDDAGRFLGYTGCNVDITEARLAAEELERRVATRTAELMAAEETLRQAQKMEAVGQLTGGIAHDFNNMLQGVTGGLDMARRRVAEGRGEDALRYLETAREAATRAAGLTRRLLAFARRQRLDPKPIEADGLVTGMADLIRRTMGPGIVVELQLSGGIGRVLCDANELESALLNLCINARDAMPEGGRLMIGTADVQLSAAEAAGQEGVAPGAYAMISVMDTGEGMPPEVLERVFEPFFTTKPLGQGTGLGLSQVYGFVRQSGGLVRLESAPGRGTTVRIFLPKRDAAEVEPDRMPPEPPAPAGAAATVLLVDDEAAVRGPAAERLRELGYRVLEAADGPAALRLLSGAARVDLLITDVGLTGGMNGRQLAEAARERLPGLPVLFITGYATTRLPAGMEVIAKPFALDLLACRVQSLLAARQPGAGPGAGPG